jgi:hypothetical protein
MIVRGVPPLKVVKVQGFRANRSKTLHFGVASDGYGIHFWTMRESPFHQLSDFQCIFLFAFGEVKIICAFVTFSADPT